MTSSLTAESLRDALLAAIGSQPRGAHRSLLEDVYRPLIDTLDTADRRPQSHVEHVQAPLPAAAPAHAQDALNAVLRAAFAWVDTATAGDPPGSWADTHDFALIDAVNDYRAAAARP